MEEPYFSSELVLLTIPSPWVIGRLARLRKLSDHKLYYCYSLLSFRILGLFVDLFLFLKFGAISTYV